MEQVGDRVKEVQNIAAALLTGSKVSQVQNIVVALLMGSKASVINVKQCCCLADACAAISSYLEGVGEVSGSNYFLETIDQTLSLLDELIRVLEKGKGLVLQYGSGQWFELAVTRGDNREAFMEIHFLLNIWLILWYDHFCGRDRSLHMPHDLFRSKENMLAYAEHDHHKILETLEMFQNNLPTAIAKLRGISNTWFLPINMEIDARKIKCGKKIGKGAYGLVREAYWLGCNFAVKIMRTSNIDALRKEVWILAKLRYPHIVQLVGFSVDGSTSMILMELMDGDLRHCIKSIGASSPGTAPFSPEETINIISQIAAGMAYLHQREVFHGDLKTSNVLVNHRGGNIEVKIADFGVSQTVELTKHSDISKQNDGNVGSSSVYSNSSGLVGTDGWRAPEMSHDQAKEGDTLLVKPTYTGKADVFSFAMTCYEVVTGNLPYSSDIPRQSIEKLVREGVRPELPKDMNRSLSSLIKKCWTNEAAERPTFEKIYSDLQEIRALEIIAPKKPTVEETCDLQEMKTLETVAPKKPTVEESCFDLQQMKALGSEAPKKPTFEVNCFDLQEMQTLETKALKKPTIEETCFDLQKMKGLKIIAEWWQKSWCTII